MTKISISKGTVKVFLLLFFLTSIGLSLYLLPLTQSQNSEEETTISNVSITYTVAISKSNNLTAGILFGSVNAPSTANNATGNFNSTDHTQFWITIDDTTNTPIDICIKTNAPLTSGSYQIPNTNYHWSHNATTNNETYPIWPATTDISTSYQYLDEMNDTQTGTAYLRFNLDIPSGQQAGDYNNTVYFKATANTTAC